MAPGLWKGSKDFCHYCSLIGLVCLCLWAFILSPLFSSFFPGLALIYSSRHSSVVLLSLGSSCVFLHFSSLGYTFPAFLATWLWLLSYCCYWFTCPHGLGARTTSFCFLSLSLFFLFFFDISQVWGRHWVNEYWMDKWTDFFPPSFLSSSYSLLLLLSTTLPSSLHSQVWHLMHYLSYPSQELWGKHYD